MAALVLTLIDTVRTPAGIIKGYILADELGGTYEYTAEQLKKDLRGHRINITNMSVGSDGKLREAAKGQSMNQLASKAAEFMRLIKDRFNVKVQKLNEVGPAFNFTGINGELPVNNYYACRYALTGTFRAKMPDGSTQNACLVNFAMDMDRKDAALLISIAQANKNTLGKVEMLTFPVKCMKYTAVKNGISTVGFRCASGDIFGISADRFVSQLSNSPYAVYLDSTVDESKEESKFGFKKICEAFSNEVKLNGLKISGEKFEKDTEAYRISLNGDNDDKLSLKITLHMNRDTEETFVRSAGKSNFQILNEAYNCTGLVKGQGNIEDLAKKMLADVQDVLGVRDVDTNHAIKVMGIFCTNLANDSWVVTSGKYRSINSIFMIRCVDKKDRTLVTKIAAKIDKKNIRMESMRSDNKKFTGQWTFDYVGNKHSEYADIIFKEFKSAFIEDKAQEKQEEKQVIETLQKLYKEIKLGLNRLGLEIDDGNILKNLSDNVDAGLSFEAKITGENNARVQLLYSKGTIIMKCKEEILYSGNGDIEQLIEILKTRVFGVKGASKFHDEAVEKVEKFKAELEREIGEPIYKGIEYTSECEDALVKGEINLNLQETLGEYKVYFSIEKDRNKYLIDNRVVHEDEGLNSEWLNKVLKNHIKIYNNAVKDLEEVKFIRDESVFKHAGSNDIFRIYFNGLLDTEVSVSINDKNSTLERVISIGKELNKQDSKLSRVEECFNNIKSYKTFADMEEINPADVLEAKLAEKCFKAYRKIHKERNSLLEFDIILAAIEDGDSIYYISNTVDNKKITLENCYRFKSTPNPLGLTSDIALKISKFSSDRIFKAQGLGETELKNVLIGPFEKIITIHTNGIYGKIEYEVDNKTFTSLSEISKYFKELEPDPKMICLGIVKQIDFRFGRDMLKYIDQSLQEKVKLNISDVREGLAKYRENIIKKQDGSGYDIGKVTMEVQVDGKKQHVHIDFFVKFTDEVYIVTANIQLRTENDIIIESDEYKLTESFDGGHKFVNIILETVLSSSGANTLSDRDAFIERINSISEIMKLDISNTSGISLGWLSHIESTENSEVWGIELCVDTNYNSIKYRFDFRMMYRQKEVQTVIVPVEPTSFSTALFERYAKTNIHGKNDFSTNNDSVIKLAHDILHYMIKCIRETAGDWFKININETYKDDRKAYDEIINVGGYAKKKKSYADEMMNELFS